MPEWRRCIPELTETVPAESKPAEFEPVETQTPPPLVSDKSDKPFIIPEFETMEPGVTMPVGWSEEQGGTETTTIAESVFENSIEIHPSLQARQRRILEVRRSFPHQHHCRANARS